MHVILIDNNSGYIWADSRNLRGYVASEHDYARGYETASITAATLIDRENMSPREHYDFWTVNPRVDSGYTVYRVDIGGIEAVPVVLDGQNQETIDAVERCCDFIGYVACS